MSVDVTFDGSQYVVALPENTSVVDVRQVSAGQLDLLVDGRRLLASVSIDGPEYWVTVDGRTYRLTHSAGPARKLAAHRPASDLTAPMPGQVRSLNVSPGDLVTQGQLLAVLEAMKMEIRLSAPFDARVVSVEARLGQSVERDQVIIHLQPS